MPLHEYECDNCGHRFERIQKFSDPPVDVCPKCGGPVHKLISSPAFQFKGSGWYITDYAKKDSPAGKGGDSKDSGKDGGKESGKDGGKESTKETKDSGSSSSESKSSESKSEGKTSGKSDSSSSSSSDSSPKS